MAATLVANIITLLIHKDLSDEKKITKVTKQLVLQ
jgi:hypothetical protein